MCVVCPGVWWGRGVPPPVGALTQLPSTDATATPRFKDETVLYTAIRERYLLFVNCIESKPGMEPTQGYLYPQPATK